MVHLQVPASVPARAAALRATTRERIDIDPKTRFKKTPKTWDFSRKKFDKMEKKEEEH